MPGKSQTHIVDQLGAGHRVGPEDELDVVPARPDAEPWSFDASAVSLRSMAGVAYLVVFGSIVAFSAYIWLLRVSTPARVSTYAYVNPVIAVLLGWMLAGEELTARIGVAAAIIVSGVALITLSPKRA